MIPSDYPHSVMAMCWPPGMHAARRTIGFIASTMQLDTGAAFKLAQRLKDDGFVAQIEPGLYRAINRSERQ